MILFEPLLAQVIGETEKNDADRCDDQKGPVLLIADATALNGQDDRAQQPSDGGDDQKGLGFDMAEAQDVAEGVLGESGNQKKQKN